MAELLKCSKARLIVVLVVLLSGIYFSFTCWPCTYYFQRLRDPLPPDVMKISLFCGRWRTHQTVELWAYWFKLEKLLQNDQTIWLARVCRDPPPPNTQTFSVNMAKPLVGCCVRISHKKNFDSKVVATSLFIKMSRRSNWISQTWKKNIKCTTWTNINISSVFILSFCTLTYSEYTNSQRRAFALS